MRFSITTQAIAAIGICLVELASPSRAGTVVLDQFNATTSSAFNLQLGFSAISADDPFKAGQVFTVGQNGILDHITVFIFGSVPRDGVTPQTVFEIRPTTPGGFPENDDSKALARLTVNLPSIPYAGFGQPLPSLDIDVRSFNIAVTAGQKLFFDLGAASENLALAGFGNSNYPRGSYYVRNPRNNINSFIDFGYDLGFQTFIEIPEPSSIVTAAICVAGLTAYRSRKSRTIWRHLITKKEMSTK